MAKSEFVTSQQFSTNLNGPVSWIMSHLRRNPWIMVMMVVGALGNALLASALPIFTGLAFDAVTGPVPNLRPVLIAGIAIIMSQTVRVGMQLGRNFGSELLGQRLERDAARNSTHRCWARACPSTICAPRARLWHAQPTTCASSR